MADPNQEFSGMIAPSPQRPADAPSASREGVLLAQSAWIYDELGYAAAALVMYARAVTLISDEIAGDERAASDESYFHRGLSQLRLGCLHLQKFDINSGRLHLTAGLPDLRKAWELNPGHPPHQKALVQLALMLGRFDIAEQVRDHSPDGPGRETMYDWIFRALQIWDRFRNDGSVVKLDTTWVNPKWTDPEDPHVPDNWPLVLLEEVFGPDARAKSGTIF